MIAKKIVDGYEFWFDASDHAAYRGVVLRPDNTHLDDPAYIEALKKAVEMYKEIVTIASLITDAWGKQYWGLPIVKIIELSEKFQWALDQQTWEISLEERRYLSNAIQEISERVNKPC